MLGKNREIVYNKKEFANIENKNIFIKWGICMKKAIGITVGVVVGIGVILGSIKPVWVRVAPASYVAKAVMKTEKVIQEEFAKRKEVFGYDMLDGKRSCDEDITFQVTGLKGEEAVYLEPLLKGAILNIHTMLSDTEDRMDMSVKAGELALGLKYYQGNDQIGLQLMDVMDDYVMVDLKNYGKTYNAWPVREMFDMPKVPEDLDLSMGEIMYPLEQETRDKLKALYTGYMKEVKVSYSGKGEVAGNKVQQFTAVIPEEMIEEFIVESIKLMIEDPKYGEILYFYQIQDGYEMEEEAFKELLRETQQYIAEGLEQIAFGAGIQIEMAIDSKGRIVQVVSDMEVKNAYDESFVMGCELALLGEQYVTDQLVAELMFQVEGETFKGSIDYASNLGENADTITEQLAMKLEEGGVTPFSIGYNTAYTPKKEADNYHLEGEMVIADGARVQVKADGTWKQDKKAQTMTLDARNVAIQIQDLSGYMAEMVVEGELAYSYQVTESKELMPSNKKYLFEMTDEQIGEVMLPIVEAFNSLMGF